MNTTNRTNLTATATLLAVVAALGAGITLGHIQNSLASSRAEAAMRELDASKRAGIISTGALIGETAVVPGRHRRSAQSADRNGLRLGFRPGMSLLAEP